MKLLLKVIKRFLNCKKCGSKDIFVTDDCNVCSRCGYQEI